MHRFFTFLFSWARARARAHVCVCFYVILCCSWFFFLFLSFCNSFYSISLFVYLFVRSFAWIKQLDDIAVQDVWNGRREQNKSDFFFSYLCFLHEFLWCLPLNSTLCACVLSKSIAIRLRKRLQWIHTHTRMPNDSI